MNAEIILKTEALCVKFGKITALDSVNIEIKKGETVVVIGPSGSGKSTLLRSFNLLEKPSGGKVFFEGKDITSRGGDIDHIRAKMGIDRKSVV